MMSIEGCNVRFAETPNTNHELVGSWLVETQKTRNPKSWTHQKPPNPSLDSPKALNLRLT